MAEQNRPASPEQAPNPANSYERAEPNREAGAGRLDNNTSTPAARPDQLKGNVPNKTDPQRQINSQEPERSMQEDSPTDADLSPQDIDDPQRKRHPRIGGKGGTPDVGENPRQS